MPGSESPEPDWICFTAYKLALAIDLKRHFQSTAQIFLWHEGRVVEITGHYELMMGSAPNQALRPTVLPLVDPQSSWGRWSYSLK